MRRNYNVQNIVSGYSPALQVLMEALQLSTGRLLNKPIACSFSIERAGYWLKNILLSELALKSTIYYYIPDLNLCF